jgi:hypothetical protein
MFAIFAPFLVKQKGIEPSICVNPRDFVFYEWQIPAHILSYASLPPLLHFSGC